ncbi:MAG: hypothetical protein ACAI35_19310, partial [Candidatus Methylacidiphilales bacterium]
MKWPNGDVLTAVHKSETSRDKAVPKWSGSLHRRNSSFGGGLWKGSMTSAGLRCVFEREAQQYLLKEKFFRATVQVTVWYMKPVRTEILMRYDIIFANLYGYKLGISGIAYLIISLGDFT